MTVIGVGRSSTGGLKHNPTYVLDLNNVGMDTFWNYVKHGSHGRSSVAASLGEYYLMNCISCTLFISSCPAAPPEVTCFSFFILLLSLTARMAAVPLLPSSYVGERLTGNVGPYRPWARGVGRYQLRGIMLIVIFDIVYMSRVRKYVIALHQW